MGCTASIKADHDHRGPLPRSNTFRPIPDRFKSIAQVQQAVRAAGLESSNLILGVDFTKSNTWTGAETFDGRCLHDTTCGVPNPYHRVIDVIGRTLEEFDDDRLIPAFGFGDSTTGAQKCFPFSSTGPIHGVQAVLERYTQVARTVTLAGPTCFAPVIRQAIDIVREEQSYHILVIVADGQVTDASPSGPTARAIIEASQYPLSIVVVGVGDGPWHAMEHYDDELPQRQFDNFQFVDFNRISRLDPRVADAQFALHALMEVPDQYKFIKDNGLLSSPAFNRAIPDIHPLAPAPPVPHMVAPPPAVGYSIDGLAYSTPRAVPPSPPQMTMAKGRGGMQAPPEYSPHDHFRSSIRHVAVAAPAAEQW